MDISVIVATRNRSVQLRKFLDRLSSHECRYDWDVVIVDNGSTDDTDSVIRSAEACLNLVHLYEERPGKCAALNKAIDHAQGRLLVFTDDDVVPGAGWLDELYQASLQFPQAVLFGGKVSIDSSDLPAWIKRSKLVRALLTSEHIRPEDSNYGEWQYPFGLNYALRREAVHAVGAKLCEQSGPGTDIPVGDETLFLMQISKPDKRDRVYIPKSNVLHEVNPGYLSITGAARRYYQLGRFDTLLNRMTSLRLPGYTPPRDIARDIWYLRQSRDFREVICLLARITGRYLQVILS